LFLDSWLTATHSQLIGSLSTSGDPPLARGDRLV